MEYHSREGNYCSMYGDVTGDRRDGVTKGTVDRSRNDGCTK